jgi:hypothetical protein
MVDGNGIVFGPGVRAVHLVVAHNFNRMMRLFLLALLALIVAASGADAACSACDACTSFVGKSGPYCIGEGGVCISNSAANCQAAGSELCGSLVPLITSSASSVAGSVWIGIVAIVAMFTI